MNITLPSGDTKSLVLIKDLSYLPLCEESEDFKSSDYSGYKPYSPPKPSKWNTKYYDQAEYITNGKCHHCDIRRTGCTSRTTPRYYFKKDKKTIQTNLGDY